MNSERLANGYMLRRARFPPASLKCRGAYEALANWTLHQGPGYRDGRQLVGARQKFDKACSDNLLEAIWAVGGATDAEFHRLYPLEDRVDWRYCPVRVVADDARLSTLLSNLFIHQIENMEETSRFCTMLEGRSEHVRRAWPIVRAKLALTTRIKGLDFMPWRQKGKDWYSVRVTGAERAHLRFESASQKWFAEEIGSHKALGHG